MTQPTTQQSGFSLAGFQNPTFDATKAFRIVLDAMSRPGKIMDLDDLCESPVKIHRSIAAVLLTLADIETQIWVAPDLYSDQLKEFLAFHTGARLTDQIAECDFALISAETSIEHFSNLPIGTVEYPDRSATVILSVQNMEKDGPLTLKGPGILETASLNVGPLPNGFWGWFRAAQQNFPCGNDVIFASARQISALARTTQVED